ncbi:MAG: IS5 family transposase [Parvibaculaceae bacterium]
MTDGRKTFEWAKAAPIPFITDGEEPPLSWEDVELSRDEWTRIYPLLPRGGRGQPRTPERDWRIINGICWIMRTGAPWRDMPRRFGSHKSAWSRLSRWTRRGIWDRIWDALKEQEEAEGHIDWTVHHVDSVTCRAHPDAAGARHPKEQSTEDARVQEKLGKSRGGWCSKIHARCEGTGKPMVLLIGAGNRHDSTMFIDVIEEGAVQTASGQTKQRPEAVAADKAYGGQKNRQHLRSKGIKATIPYKSNKKNPRPQDQTLYKKRNIVERCFRWMQRYRRLAIRYEKRGENFRAFWVIGAIRMWIRDPFAG